MTAKSKRSYEDFEVVKTITSGGVRPYLVDGDLEFVRWSKAHIDHLASNDRSPRTLENNVQAHLHLAAYMKFHNLKSLTDFDSRTDLLYGFREWLRNPYAHVANNVAAILPIDPRDQSNIRRDSTINLYMGCVCALLKDAYIRGLIKKDPIPYTRRPVPPRRRAAFSLVANSEERFREVNGLRLRVPREHPKVLSKAKWKAALSACRKLRDQAILLVLYEGGFRAGELLGMRVEDLDFPRGGINVVSRTDNPNGALATGADRFVSMPDQVMALLHHYLSSDWLASRPQTDLIWVVVASPVARQNGSPMDKDTLRSLFDSLGKRAKIDIHPHLLRHTHITNLVREFRRRGEPIDWKFIADRVGHENISETMQTYAHLSPEDHKPEFERLRQRRADAAPQTATDNSRSPS